jgi:hypothetical protein
VGLIVVALVGAMALDRPAPTAAPQSEGIDATKTAIWRDSIRIVWGDQSWYANIQSVWVIGHTGTVQVLRPVSVDEICSDAAVATYDDQARPIGIYDVRVINMVNELLASCPAD